MTFLIIKIAAYLVVALVLGCAAGWISRHIAAQRDSDAMSRQLNDNRAKVPQLESLIRVRDDELKRLKLVQDEQQAETQQAKEALHDQKQAVRNKEVEIARLKTQLDNVQRLSAAMDDDTALVSADLVPSSPEPDASVAVASSNQDALVNELKARIQELELELTDARFQLDAAKADDGLRSEMDELTNRLRQKAQDFDRLTRQMDAEKRKVAELERERELQNKSLQVLHQQLEMERTDESAASSTLGAS